MRPSEDLHRECRVVTGYPIGPDSRLVEQQFEAALGRVESGAQSPRTPGTRRSRTPIGRPTSGAHGHGMTPVTTATLDAPRGGVRAAPHPPGRKTRPVRRTSPRSSCCSLAFGLGPLLYTAGCRFTNGRPLQIRARIHRTRELPGDAGRSPLLARPSEHLLDLRALHDPWAGPRSDHRLGSSGNPACE